MTALITNHHNANLITRRSIFIGAAASLICAPAIVRVASLMPIRGIVLAERNYYGFVDRLYVHSYLPTIRKCQDAGLSAHGIANEMNNYGSRSMNGDSWDAGRVLGVIKRDEAIRRSDAMWRRDRLKISET